MLDDSLPEVEELDRRWTEWKAVVRSCGVNAGSWVVVNDEEDLVTAGLKENKFGFQLDVMLVDEDRMKELLLHETNIFLK